ncbi:hypothetical protein SEA_ROONEY_104 [Streptomyces phage Rooney]|nr:hypothetical protein SEA_ROONEY_104 [Streptomyces phage Rooney]
MAIRTATPELHERMRKASASIAAGVRLNKPDIELQGRRLSARAHIENQILLGRAYLTSEDCQHLAELLFSTNPADFAHDPIDDATADAVETSAEALAMTRATSDDDYDEDLEGDED